MKQLFTLMALLLTSVTFGQETCNNVFDYNDNNTIDIEDFLAILGLFADVDLDDDGTWDSQDNCLDLSACNYASELNEPCTYLPPGDCDCNGNVLDECGVCGGTGLAPGTCDCSGTLIDVIGECGGDCWVDEDADGICDDVDECVGEYDACDVCNGPGAIYECGCANIPAGECDCDGNVLDAIGVCGGACSADEDADGVCDDVDNCVGEFDVCGVCNGPGEAYECGCGDVPEGECDCEGNVLDALGECGGECLADEDGDGVCDDEDDCVGQFDECGVCNGDGAVYECGCNNIPEGECDCDGNVFDECGVCNGPGPTEIVIEDIVTYYDSVYLPFDDAWYVYPVDADTTFGFTCAPFVAGCGEPVSYQGYEYATVQIGEQCWFAENLRGEQYLNGDAILSEAELGILEVNTANEGVFHITDYGHLYNEEARDDVRQLCPTGWKVPTHYDWTVLEATLGGQASAGIKMKSTSGWLNGGNGTNESGFNALPGGYHEYYCCFYEDENTGEPYLDYFWGGLEGQGYAGAWWSTSGSKFVSSDTDALIDGTLPGSIYPDALSIRCIGARGCTDTNACNFDPFAVTDDGSCEYDEPCTPPFQSCGDPIGYQGYYYPTVQIGNQCWFAENLRNENFASGEPIPSEVPDSEWQTGQPACTVYGEGESSCFSYNSNFDACLEDSSLSQYGRLYNHQAVMYMGELCPSGWHTPSRYDWEEILETLGDSPHVKLKSTQGWELNDGTSHNGTDDSGFGGLPSGRRNASGTFENGGNEGYFWSSSYSWAYPWSLRLTQDTVLWSQFRDPSSGFSVRCIQDEPEVLGCIDPSACNYDEFANANDGSCEFISCLISGCIDSAACNYDELADTDDGSCEYETCGPVCGDPMNYQGYDYATVQIGDQCWFAENLRNRYYQNGDSIPSGLSDSDWTNTSSGAVAIFGEGESTCWDDSPGGFACDEIWSLGEYGRLYNWWAVSDVRGLCPVGWHVPSDSEWEDMIDVLGGYLVAGASMKTTYGWFSDFNGSNASGFAGLPGGHRWYQPEAYFSGSGTGGYWWSSTPGANADANPDVSFDDTHALLRYIEWTSFGQVHQTYSHKNVGNSVRCIQNTEE